MPGSARVSRHFSGAKIIRMIQRSERFRAFGWAGGWSYKESSQNIVIDLCCEIFFLLRVQCVHESVIKALFPMGCDFNGEDGDALGSEYADENR